MLYHLLRLAAIVATVSVPLTVGPAVVAATPATTIKAIAAGSAHTCAVASNGTAWCWGSNDHGQLGDGTTLERHRPVQVTRGSGGYLSGIVAISAGANDTCAVTGGGAAWCWGANDRGQLGDGSTIDRHAPVRVTRSAGVNLAGVTAISTAAWAGHTCAATSDGAAWCWGSNGHGELGDGTIIDRHRAVHATRAGGANLAGVTMISAGGLHTCARTVSGAAWCWGDNYDGELGDGSTIERHRAVRVTKRGGGNLTGITAINAADSAGIVAFFYTCARGGDGAVWCWGGNYDGELGDGTTNDHHRAARVVDGGGGSLSGITAISTGLNHTCAITSRGGIECWGSNWEGQLGDGVQGYGTGSNVPVDVIGVASGATAVAAGEAHTCVITSAGGAKCWGWNGAGQLGDGTTMNRSVPVDVLAFTVWIAAIAAGSSHTCAITSIGGVKCWGSNAYGQLGDGTKTDSSLPVDVGGLAQGIIAITAGIDNTCALTVVGGVKCWGSNRFGQLGNGATTDSSVPVAVFGLWRGVRVISGQWAHTCALTAVGAVRCWGLNTYGQLGNGTTTNASIAVNVAGLSRGALGITAGGGHTCAIFSAGQVQCWGWNSFAQLGNGSTVDSTVPVDVVGLPDGVNSIFAGDQHTCGLTSIGAVLCWGNNLSGQLGNGAPSAGSGPIAASSPTGDVVAVAGGGNHTCALSRLGGISCWGFNHFGELGLGTTTFSPVPVAVAGLESGVSAVTAGQYHTCAVTPIDGGAKCWGQNADGQLGDGTRTDGLTPVKVGFTVPPSIALSSFR